MTTIRQQRALTAAVLLAMGVAVAISFAAASAATPAKISAAGVGAVKLGRSYCALRVAGLVGRIGPGCELAGPNPRSAPPRPAGRPR